MKNAVVNKFNRGEVDALAMVRDDVSKINNSCALMENWFPIRLGAMMVRPGFEHLGTVPGVSHNVPFVAATDDVANLEFTDELLRLWVNDVLITRTSVTSTLTNENFTSDLTGWTDSSGAGATAAWVTGGYASLTGTDTTSAQIYQTMSTELGAEHAVRFVILRGPVLCRIGTSGDGSDDIFRGVLGPGTHSLVFTPASAATITLSTSERYASFVDSVEIESAGTLTLPTNAVEDDLQLLRYTQSADVMYFGLNGIAQFKVERRGTKSWSIGPFLAGDGPFNTINSGDITMAPGNLNGDTTLTTSEDYFNTDHVGSLFKIGSSGQEVNADISAADAGTDAIRVTGVENTRVFTVSVAGTFTATVTLQRSTDELSWDSVKTYTGVSTEGYDDGFDNSIFYYRLYIEPGDYTSGTAECTLTYASGSIEGIARVTEYTSKTVVNCQVLTSFGDTDATVDWYEGSWSDDNGHPSAVNLYEGRLWWAGKSKLWGSVSDAYTSFDRDLEGDSKSIVKTIGYGPVDGISWLAESTRLIMGIASDEIAVRSSSFGEVLTQTNANLKSGSNRGAAPINPLKIDDNIYYVQRSGAKIFSLAYQLSNDVHTAVDLTVLHRRVCEAGIKRIVYTREPETRIFAILDDGTVRIYMFDLTEEVAAWSRVSAANGGLIEDVVVLPATSEDRVYFIVNRGGTRYREKMALFSEAEAGNISKHFDSFTQYSSPGTTITGLTRHEGETVGVWADGQDRGTYTVSSGQITVATAWTDVIVGLPYNADYKSNKLNRYLPSSVLTHNKRVTSTSVILANMQPGALTIGPTEALRKSMPDIENGKLLDTTVTLDEYDELPFEFDGEDETDPRIYMRATGPCTIAALCYEVWSPPPKPKSSDEG